MAIDMLIWVSKVADAAVSVVGYIGLSILLTNTGTQPWTDSTGMPCIWMLDMFKPSLSHNDHYSLRL